MASPCKKCGQLADDLVDGICIWCEDTKEIVMPSWRRNAQQKPKTPVTLCPCGGDVKKVDWGFPNKKPELQCIKCGKGFGEAK